MHKCNFFACSMLLPCYHMPKNSSHRFNLHDSCVAVLVVHYTCYMDINLAEYSVVVISWVSIYIVNKLI